MPLDLFGLLPETTDREEAESVLRSLHSNCKACRLGLTTDRQNEGIAWSGPTTAKLAFLGDQPDFEATQLPIRQPFAGEPRRELERWLRRMGVGTADVFCLNSVQCKTKRSPSKEPAREPFKQESDVCFPQRALRVLKAMPNLEVVVTLGWVSAAALLGSKPKPRQKSHGGQWFGTDLLPGVAVFCLDHPRVYDLNCKPKQRGRLLQCLEFFETEYLRPETAKILEIYKLRASERNS
jgi:uracil-DNA glycosylase family 4